MSIITDSRIKTCGNPAESVIKDGRLHRVQTCGCVRVYGRYQGIGDRPYLYTVLCRERQSYCPDCGLMDYPHSDCHCGEDDQ